MTTNHTIEMRRNTYNNGWEPAVRNLEIKVIGVRNRAFGLGQVDKGRAEYRGPMIENLAYLFPLCTVIRATPRPEDPQIIVSLGDTLEFLGRKFEVISAGDGYKRADLRELK